MNLLTLKFYDWVMGCIILEDITIVKMFMARKLASLLKKILPDDFVAKQAEFHQMEMFLKHFFKPEIVSQIQLMSCVSKRVVLAAKNPQAATFIKLNQQDLEQQMSLQLNVSYRVLVKTNPNSISLSKPKKVILPKVKRSQQGAKALQQIALTVEDDALQQSLDNLAKSLSKKG